MNQTDLEKQLRQAEWPEPSPELRAQILSNVPTVDRSITWSDRVWFSRRWRVSFVAACLMLVATVLYPGRQSADAVVSTVTVARTVVIEEVVRAAGLTESDAVALVRRSSVATRTPAIDANTLTALAVIAPGGER